VVEKTLHHGVAGKIPQLADVDGKTRLLEEVVAEEMNRHQELQIAEKKRLLEIVAIEMTLPEMAAEEKLLPGETEGGDLQVAPRMTTREGAAEGAMKLTLIKLTK